MAVVLAAKKGAYASVAVPLAIQELVRALATAMRAHATWTLKSEDS